MKDFPRKLHKGYLHVAEKNSDCLLLAVRKDLFDIINKSHVQAYDHGFI